MLCAEGKEPKKERRRAMYREKTTLCAQESSGYHVDQIKRNDLGQSFTIQESRDRSGWRDKRWRVEYLPNIINLVGIRMEKSRCYLDVATIHSILRGVP